MEFTDIALAKFLQIAPELGPYILNFSEVNDEMGDSGSGVKVGVFIIKTGSGLGYVPVISKGDTVFPIDSVFLESESIFRPLSPSTINYIINTSASTLGKSVKIPNTVDQNPSLMNMINPPRTGKFVYASASRLPEFLAVVPSNIRKSLFEKIAAEQSVYSSLDKLFGLKAIFSVLNGDNGGSGVVNNVATGPDLVRSNNLSVITTPQEVKALLNDAASKTFLDQGYVIQGVPGAFRAAVSYFPYDKIGNYTTINPASDGGRDYKVAMENGTTGTAFVPKYHLLNPNPSKSSLISVFPDGTYARGEMIAVGGPLLKEDVLNILFALNPPKLLKELNIDDKFLVFTTSGEALGPFRAQTVTRTGLGVEIKTYAGKVNRICGYTNFTKEVDVIGDTLFLPFNVIVLPLLRDVTDELERSINSALNKSELAAAQFLGQDMNLRYDGVEFSTDSRVLGEFASAMKYLVEGEQIEPVVADNFLKQAQETGYLKVFMSKAASAASTDFTPTEIPQYGTSAPMDQQVGLNGALIPSIQSSTALGDSQVVESTIISQLLQVPELFEYIQEYLPELEQTVDRLGRILFITRVKIDQISASLDSDSVFSMISQIKTVYRQLGDTTLKLKGLANASAGYNREEAGNKSQGV
jgi:hypothetical protein